MKLSSKQNMSELKRNGQEQELKTEAKCGQVHWIRTCVTPFQMPQMERRLEKSCWLELDTRKYSRRLATLN